jgi:AraC-like DNA-binding protein
VSFALGFKSASSFARTIKRVCGFSPGELRRRIARDLPVALAVGLSEENCHVNMDERSAETRRPVMLLSDAQIVCNLDD